MYYYVAWNEISFVSDLLCKTEVKFGLANFFILYLCILRSSLNRDLQSFLNNEIEL